LFYLIALKNICLIYHRLFFKTLRCRTSLYTKTPISFRLHESLTFHLAERK
jgi:hypothetical protein